MSNLRMIGQALYQYANINHGRFPDDLQSLVSAGMLQSRCLVCPGSSDTPAAGATTQAVVQQLSFPGHNSYIFLGKGMKAKKGIGKVIIAYERVANHPKANYALFGDGHVEYIPAATLKLIQPKLT